LRSSAGEEAGGCLLRKEGDGKLCQNIDDVILKQTARGG